MDGTVLFELNSHFMIYLKLYVRYILIRSGVLAQHNDGAVCLHLQSSRKMGLCGRSFGFSASVLRASLCFQYAISSSQYTFLFSARFFTENTDKFSWEVSLAIASPPSQQEPLEDKDQQEMSQKPFFEQFWEGIMMLRHLGKIEFLKSS